MVDWNPYLESIGQRYAQWWTVYTFTDAVGRERFSIQATRPDSTDTFPSITPGAIASGEKVIANADFRDALVAQHRKIKAIEMEGYGVHAAAHQRHDPTRCLVIRALCDYADGEKNDTWHHYAAAAAAGFTKHFLLDMPLEPRNK